MNTQQPPLEQRRHPVDGRHRNISRGVRAGDDTTLVYIGVIVKSGVCPFESSGDLVEFYHLDSVFEFDSGYHLCQVIESA